MYRPRCRHPAPSKEALAPPKATCQRTRKGTLLVTKTYGCVRFEHLKTHMFGIVIGDSHQQTDWFQQTKLTKIGWSNKVCWFHPEATFFTGKWWSLRWNSNTTNHRVEDWWGTIADRPRTKQTVSRFSKRMVTLVDYTMGSIISSVCSSAFAIGSTIGKDRWSGAKVPVFDVLNLFIQSFLFPSLRMSPNLHGCSLCLSWGSIHPRECWQRTCYPVMLFPPPNNCFAFI